ncbi:leucine-rich repeat extensin-like protein 1 [Nothobranchius furzeri]|uniref:Leucine-rich repeat extensin-like protein 1 n=1 Tax=Nothobranchius furzeri TaxID=105023 RepID=A0A9D3BM63_NOTFU|nr:leucine-rich repeat extensin-like protein 1 [Nothobranchius furzeri]
MLYTRIPDYGHARPPQDEQEQAFTGRPLLGVFNIMLMLLLVGDVELNPGPQPLIGLAPWLAGPVLTGPQPLQVVLATLPARPPLPLAGPLPLLSGYLHLLAGQSQLPAGPQPLFAGSSPLLAGLPLLLAGSAPCLAGPPPLLPGPSPLLHGPPLKLHRLPPLLSRPSPLLCGLPPQLHGPPPQLHGLPPLLHEPPPPLHGPSPQLHGPPPQLHGPPPLLHGPPPPLHGLSPLLHGPLPTPARPQPPPAGLQPIPAGPQPIPAGPTPIPAEPQSSPAGPQPPPAGLQPIPAGPQPIPAGPTPIPAEPQSSPAGPQPLFVRPQPTSASPQLIPAGPKPPPAGPQPAPARPQPIPAGPQPSPARPQLPPDGLHSSPAGSQSTSRRNALFNRHRITKITTSATYGYGSRQTFPKGHRNPVLKRHRITKIFRTLNQAKVVWDLQSRVKGLLGGHLNIRSMRPKREQLEHLLCNSLIDFLGLSETWLNRSSPEVIVKMPNYNVFRKDIESGRGGGVLIYVRISLKCTKIEWPSHINLECVGVEISLSETTSFIVVCVYRKPTAYNYFYDQLNLLLNHCGKTKEIILLGDFNIKWDIKKEHSNLKQITDYFNLTQIIKNPTRITNQSETLIDLLFTNRAERITKT